MKLCHFSDSHLGAGDNHDKRGPSGLTLRQEDIVSGFTAAIDQIIAIRPDLCIHAGDIFHTVRPTNRILAIAVEQMHRLAALEGIPTVIITGNHDAPKQPHIGAALEVFKQIDNLHVVAGTVLEVLEVAGVRVFALPHSLTTKILSEQLALCKPDPEIEHNVLICHGVAAGMPEFSMADLGEQEIPIEVMNQFGYTALGHYHNVCAVAPRAWYSGSTERLSQSERSSPKGFLEVDLNPFRTTFHEVATRPMVDLPIVDATGKRGDQLMEIIRRKVQEVGSGDKIVRLNVHGVTEETMKTLPSSVLADLKQNSFDLNIRFQKEKDESAPAEFGRSAIGRLDLSFMQYLEMVKLDGFDRDRLKREAEKYLRTDE